MKRSDSPLVYLLKALIPYSKESMTLGFKPNRFFNELENNTGYKRKTLQTAYYRARNDGLIVEDTITDKGWDKLEPFIAKTLQKDVVLMVIFDIPEELAPLRQNLRRFLKRHNFKQEQLSVWINNKDLTDYTKKYIEKLSLQDFVQVYEAARIS